LHFPMTNLRILGALFFVVALGYLFLCFYVRKTVHIFGKEFDFPAPRLAIAQLIVAGVDILAAAFCMYILLPGHLNITFFEFVPSYLLAQVAAVLTHVPGGVGIFELVIINLTHTDQTQVVFAAVLLFRLIYYILPLLLACFVFAAYELAIRKSVFEDTGRLLSVLSHSIMAYLTFACGIFFLISSLWPVAKATVLNSYLSVPVANIGHYLYVLSGCGLLFFSYGLERRERRSRNWVVIFLLVGILGAALDYTSIWIVFGGLLVLSMILTTRHRFYRASFFFKEALPSYWIVGAFLGCFIVIFAGIFCYHDSFSWQTFSGNNEFFNACRAMRSLVLMLVVVGLMLSFHGVRRDVQK
ncbi:MAG: lysylphosphatidylglycerol synthetase family protein, partial [Desulfovibrio sp.]|nr:lysylphosphatidylglycerol synthetase family protein [Desulfovibrio sp.]